MKALYWWLLGGTGAAFLLVFTKKGQSVVTTIKSKALSYSSALAALPTYWDALQQVANETGVPAEYLAGIMWRESAFGLALSPPGPTGTGDNGHGRGLMQIDDRSFPDFTSSDDWMDPYQNIKQGAAVLTAAVNYFSKTPASSVFTIRSMGLSARATALLADRVGVGIDDPLNDPRPLSGRDLVQAALASYNAGAGTVRASMGAGKGPDYVTTGNNYGVDTLSRIDAVASRLGVSSTSPA